MNQETDHWKDLVGEKSSGVARFLWMQTFLFNPYPANVENMAIL